MKVWREHGHEVVVPPPPPSPSDTVIAPPPSTRQPPPPPGSPAPPGPSPAVEIKLNGFAVTSMVLGIFGLFALTALLAVIFGHIALSQIRQAKGWQRGTGMALAGVILGWSFLAIFLSLFAVLGYLSGRAVPPAPRLGPPIELDFNVIRASWRLISATMHIKRLFLAIMSISFFWMIATVIIIIFPPMVKNDFTASKEVASLFLAIFSIGVAVGSVAVNRLLQGKVSARYSPISVIVMAAFVWFFQFESGGWVQAPAGVLYSVSDFLAQPYSWRILFALFGIATFGGMFVVPLYAFMTTTVSGDQTARTVAANNVVNSGAMVFGALVIIAATAAGLSSQHALLIVCGMCVLCALLAMKLQQACNRHSRACLAEGAAPGELPN